MQPTPPSLGYGPAQHIQYDGTRDAEALRKAMKGIGTDEKALIRTLADKDALQINVIRQAYTNKFKRQLIADVKSEVSGWFEEGLCAIIRGPLQQDVHLLFDAMDGMGTKEKVLNDVLLGRSNADIRAIKDAYQQTTRRSLENDIKGDLSMKTERHFLMVLAGNRNEEAAPVIPQDIDRDVMDLYKATEGKVGTDELLVCNILTQRSDAQIRAISHTYKQKFTRDLETVIRKVLFNLTFPNPETNMRRNSPVTWKMLLFNNFALVPTKPCAMPCFSRTPWQGQEPKMRYSHKELYAFTGIATT